MIEPAIYCVLSVGGLAVLAYFAIRAFAARRRSDDGRGVRMPYANLPARLTEQDIVDRAGRKGLR